MKLCPCCLLPINAAECTGHRAWVIPGMLYGLMLEHGCGSTQTLIMHEVTDEVLIEDDEAYLTNSLLDTRAHAGAAQSWP